MEGEEHEKQEKEHSAAGGADVCLRGGIAELVVFLYFSNTGSVQKSAVFQSIDGGIFHKDRHVYLLIPAKSNTPIHSVI